MFASARISRRADISESGRRSTFGLIGGVFRYWQRSTTEWRAIAKALRAGPIGTLRVAEHFTVGHGKITRIRQVHDTAAVRAAGLAR